MLAFSHLPLISEDNYPTQTCKGLWPPVLHSKLLSSVRNTDDADMMYMDVYILRLAVCVTYASILLSLWNCLPFSVQEGKEKSIC